MRRALAEAAWAATRTKDSYLQAQYHRLPGRRGKKRALMAVGHTLLVIIYHILKYRVDYHDLGPNYFLEAVRKRNHCDIRTYENASIACTDRNTGVLVCNHC